MQYTVRDIPRDVDRALRAKAKAEGKSLNKALLEVVKRGLGMGGAGKSKRNLRFMGGLSDQDAKAIEEAHEFFDRGEIDQEQG
jgi:hypothetical protein